MRPTKFIHEDTGVPTNETPPDEPAGTVSATATADATRARSIGRERVALKLGLLIVLLAVSIISPEFGIKSLNTNLMTTVCIYGIAATGLNLMFGYGGMLSLGNAIFMGVGGYTAAIASQTYHWNMISAFVLGIVFSGVAALVLGVFLVRLSGHYFGVASLGLALAFSGLLVAVPGTGGGSGFTVTPTVDLGFTVISSERQWYIVCLIVAVVAVSLFSWIVAGKRGRLFRLVRHDELAAAVLGVPVFRLKLLAFTLGGLITGIAGALLFVSQGVINPDTVGTVTSVQLAMLVVIGGAGYRLGGIVGAFAVFYLQALVGGLGDYELLIYGAALLLVVFYLRPGLEGGAIALWHRLQRPSPPPVVAPAEVADLAKTAEGDLAAEPGASSPGLIVQGARRTFGRVVALDSVSMTVPAGKVTALIGANGAGKSTLINVISGVEPLESGSVRLNGEEIGALSPAVRTRKGVVRTFQVPRLVDELSVIENIALGHEASERPLLRRHPKDEAERLLRARATLTALSLERLADRPASSLGTGERKYVEIARAVFSQTLVMLLDEPAVGLSSDEVTHLRIWLEKLRAAGAAILVIDHNIDFIRELADHVYSMENGRITWDGAPADVPVHSYRPTAGEVAAAPTAAVSAEPDAMTSSTESAGGALSVADLSAGYGRVTVLRDIAFAVQRGEVLGLAGPNGAGKTTLLSALAGLNSTSRGKVALDGARLDKLAAHQRVGRGLALVPEGRQIIGSISVEANLEITRAGSGRSRSPIGFDAQLEQMFTLFPRLAERRNVPGSVLSGGEQQMLAIARALMTSPKVLLLDEPSQGLSPALVTTMVEALLQLKRTMTIIIVEQNEHVLDVLADRTLNVSLGRISG